MADVAADAGVGSGPDGREVIGAVEFRMREPIVWQFQLMSARPQLPASVRCPRCARTGTQAPPAQGLGVRPPSAAKTSREARHRGLLARVALGSAFILGAAMMLTFFYVAWMSFVPAVRAIRGGLQTVGEIQAASGGLVAVIAIWLLLAFAAASQGGSASKVQGKRGKFKPSCPSEEVRRQTPHARQSSRAGALDNE